MDIIPHGLMQALSSNIDDRTLHELYAWYVCFPYYFILIYELKTSDEPRLEANH